MCCHWMRRLTADPRALVDGHDVSGRHYQVGKLRSKGLMRYAVIAGCFDSFSGSQGRRSLTVAACFAVEGAEGEVAVVM